MIICRKCGLELEETMLYCPLCRTSVNMEDEEKEQSISSPQVMQTGAKGLKQLVRNLFSLFKRIFHT